MPSTKSKSRHWRRRSVAKFLYISETEAAYFTEAAKARVRKLSPDTPPTRNKVMFQPFMRVAARRYAKKLLGCTLQQFTEKQKGKRGKG